MSVMVAEVYRALLNAGADEELAREAALAVPGTGDLATRADLKDLELRLGAEIKKLETRLGAEIKKLELRIGRDMSVLKFAYGPVIIALLVKLAFFP